MATAGEKKKLMISMKKLPVGYRLNPTDEDLINHHLIRKLKDTPEEYCLIPEFDIYKLPPWDLITKFNDMSDLASDGSECFFFHRRNNAKSKSINRKTKNPEGFWKATGKGRDPQETDRNKWSKKYLVYHLGKQKSATRTDWAMHEYKNISDQSVVICRIHKIKPKNGKENAGFGSSEVDSGDCPITTNCSETLIEPRDISPEASASMTPEAGSPWQPQMMPPAEILPHNIITSFKEIPRSTLDIQTAASPPNSDALSLEQMKMMMELTPYNIQPSSDSSEGEIPNTLSFGQSPETNLDAESPQAESPQADWDFDVESMVASFIASPQWEGVMGNNPLPED